MCSWQKASRIILSLYLQCHILHMSQIRELIFRIYKEHFKINAPYVEGRPISSSSSFLMRDASV